MTSLKLPDAEIVFLGILWGIETLDTSQEQDFMEFVFNFLDRDGAEELIRQLNRNHKFIFGNSGGQPIDICHLYEDFEYMKLFDKATQERIQSLMRKV